MVDVVLSPDFKIEIPEELLKQLNLEAGARFTLFTHGDHLELVPVHPIEWYRGRYPGVNEGEYRDRNDRV